jgi:acetyl esterase/lipase
MGGSGGASGAAGSAGATFTYEPIQGAKWDELPLFEGDPPNFKSGAPAETLTAEGHIGNVSVPTLRRYAMDGSKATGWGYLVFPGGGYSILDMDTHAAKLAERVGPLGIAVLSVKYRVGGGSDDAPRDALLDAKRAIRIVKQNAQHWGIATAHLGIIGYSAGSHLALNLAASFDAGDPQASDPIEKHSSRPSFVGSMATWSFGAKVSPFTFPNDVPPTFFCHAEDDTTAPIDLPKAIDAQIKAKGSATQLDFYATGAHSTCHPGDPSMAGHDWPNKLWPFIQSAVP